jgi:cyclohexadieny/prephenate dehydrogenase
MFNRVCIIGFGLIGSSLARAIRKNNLSREIICVDKDASVCERALSLGLADKAIVGPADGVVGADLVVIATPVGAYDEVILMISGHLKKDTIVTDVGSVKQAVIKSARPLIDAHIAFIPVHPIAGTADSGPDAGSAELFAGRWIILTSEDNDAPLAQEKIIDLWRACGGKVVIMTASQHDNIFAAISHLPQMIAYSLVNAAADLERQAGHDILAFFGSGFKDTTRIAGSNPDMWRDICLYNKDAILQTIHNFKVHIALLEGAIAAEDAKQLEAIFSEAYRTRREKIDV